MDRRPLDHASEIWRNQELARFARRAHARLGRGFVIADRGDRRPVYVTEILGAPQPLIDEVYSYDPKNEALIVSTDSEIDDAVTISRIRIETSH
jgi:hypothetical protein